MSRITYNPMTSEKANIEYWDEIDNACANFVKAFIKNFAVSNAYLDEQDVLEISTEIREKILEELQRYGVDTGTAFPTIYAD